MNVTMDVNIAMADVPNRNNHVYTTETLQSVVDAFNAKSVLGNIGMRPNVDIGFVSHQIVNLRLVDGALVGTMTTLATPEGIILAEMLDGEVPVAFRTAGRGQPVTRDDGTIEITEFEVIGVHAVNADDAA